MITEKNWPIRVYQACDVLPYVSTVTNGATLLFQAAVAKGYCSRSVRNSEFGKYLANKNKLTCAVLLVPRYGNIVYVVYQLFMYVKGVTEANKAENAQIESLKRTLKGHIQCLANYSMNIGRINDQMRSDPCANGVEGFGTELGNLQQFLNLELHEKFCQDVKNAAKKDEDLNHLLIRFNNALSIVIVIANKGNAILQNNDYDVTRSRTIIANIEQKTIII